MKKLLKLFKYVFPYWSYGLAHILSNLLAAVFSLASIGMIVPFLRVLFGKIEPVLQQPVFSYTVDSVIRFIHYYIAKIITIYGKPEALAFICFVVVGCFIIKNVFLYLALYFIAPIRTHVVMDIRNSIFNKMLILPLAYFSDRKKGDILARASTDVQEIEMSVLSSFEMIVRDPINIIIFLVGILWISPSLTLFVFVLLPIAGLIIGRIAKSLKLASEEAQSRLGNLVAEIEEAISGLRVIKAFNAIDFAYKRFSGRNSEYTSLMTKVYQKRDLASPLSEFMGACVMIVIMWYGGKIVLGGNDSLPAETFILYIVLFSQLIAPAKSFTTAYYNIQKGIVSIDRINVILDADEQIIEKPDAVSIKDFHSLIEYNDVSFSYDEAMVLKNVDLKIEKGKTIALVGVSGGGKTSLVNLLPRFYDTSSGEVMIDGLNIKDALISDVRALVGIVTQDTILFNDTIFNNIAFGMDNVTEEQVRDAAKIANAHDFITKMEKGYHSYLSDSGDNLSGGQRQRISIARAVLKNPPILILDEATSALDPESEKLVHHALTNLMKNRTTIMVAHRLSTIRMADEIVVFERGEISEQGSHDELVEKNGVYKKLYDLQNVN